MRTLSLKAKGFKSGLEPSNTATALFVIGDNIVCTVSTVNQPEAAPYVCNLDVGESAQIALKNGTVRTITLLDVKSSVTAFNGFCNFIYRVTANVEVDNDVYSIDLGLTQP